jgi:hypothetical protein
MMLSKKTIELAIASVRDERDQYWSYKNHRDVYDVTTKEFINGVAAFDALTNAISELESLLEEQEKEGKDERT